MAVRIPLPVALVLNLLSCGWQSGAVGAQPPPQLVDPLPISAHTGDKPQSKLWQHGSQWYAALPDSDGTWIWRLDGTAWERGMRLYGGPDSHADVLTRGDVVHVLLCQGRRAELVSAEYDSGSGSYRPWSQRPAASRVTLHAEVETATIAIDGDQRLWLAADTDTLVQVHWSDPPYVVWNGPLTAASGIHRDDISLIVSLTDGSVGVLWSNQNAQRFGLRTHAAGAAPQDWSPDEVPAARSALPVGHGMSDDHLNAAAATDGTLYCAVKTSYDTEGYPLVALLVRRPDGTWDELHSVDDEGSRGIVVLDEGSQTVCVVYSSYRDGQIVCRRSPMQRIRFGPRQTLISRRGINNLTTSKANAEGRALVVASAPVDSPGGAALEALGALLQVGQAR